MSIIAETPRLTIREFLPDELETYLNHFTDERVLLHIPKRGREERVGIFNKALAQYAGTKTLGIWGIFNKATGEFMGSCLLRPFGQEPGTVEVGYSFDQKQWGKGFAGEMAVAMVKHGFTHPGITKIVGITTLANIGSQRVLEKAGLIRQDNIMEDGVELAYFSLGR